MWTEQLEATHITQPIHTAHSQHAPSHKITHIIPILPPIQPNTYFIRQIHICSSAQKQSKYFFMALMDRDIQRRGSSLQTYKQHQGAVSRIATLKSIIMSPLLQNQAPSGSLCCTAHLPYFYHGYPLLRPAMYERPLNDLPVLHGSEQYPLSASSGGNSEIGS